MPWKIVLWVIIIFLVYLVFAAPNQAAVMVKGTWDGAFEIVRNGAQSLQQFTDTLISS